MNSVNLLGRIGSDKFMKIRYSQAGKAVVNFTIAVNGFENGEKTTYWFDCTAFDKVAENIAEYCRQGDQIAVNGALCSSVWEAENGSTRRRVYVKVFAVDFCGGKGEKETSAKRLDKKFEEVEEIPF